MQAQNITEIFQDTECDQAGRSRTNKILFSLENADNLIHELKAVIGKLWYGRNQPFDSFLSGHSGKSCTISVGKRVSFYRTQSLAAVKAHPDHVAGQEEPPPRKDKRRPVIRAASGQPDETTPPAHPAPAEPDSPAPATPHKEAETPPPPRGKGPRIADPSNI